MKKLSVRTWLLLLFFINSGLAIANDFNDGLKAYQSSDFKTALLVWTPLAEQGDADAQRYLGYMYHLGKGVQANIETSVKWYTLAAEQVHSNEQIVMPQPAATPTIDIINYGKFKTSDLEAWTRAGTAHLSDWQADTLGVTWDVGRQTRERFSNDYPFSKHKVMLTDQQHDQISDQIEQWIWASSCIDDDYRAAENQEGLKNINLWMRGGASVASAPDPCYDKRMVLIARTPDQDKNTFQQIWLHEFYHAHSNYLQNYCVDIWDPNLDEKLDAFEVGRWFGEATAQYFAIMVSAQLRGIKDPISDMLGRAKQQSQREGTDLFADLAGNSAVALRLLIERGNIPNLEADVMSGAVFHSCDWKDQWAFGSNEEHRFAINNWHQIKQSGGKWMFKSKALK